MLVDTSVFCRAVMFKTHKGINLTLLLQRLWEECYCWIVTTDLLEEYADCLKKEGLPSWMMVYKFIERMGTKVRWVEVSDDEMEETLDRNPKLRAIDEDLSHLIAAQKGKAEFCVFIEDAVESRSSAIKRGLGVTIMNPTSIEDQPPLEKCTQSRIPFPFP